MGFEAAQRGPFDDDAARQMSSQHGHRDLEAAADVGGAADDLQSIGAVGGDLAHRQLLSIRMTADGQHLTHDHVGKRRRHGRHRLHFETGEREPLGQLRRRHVERREFTQPVMSNLHGNCFRNCKSFSKNNRRSSTP
jgi:hypothetical protein